MRINIVINTKWNLALIFYDLIMIFMIIRIDITALAAIKMLRPIVNFEKLLALLIFIF